jgi:hypothetical protein
MDSSPNFDRLVLDPACIMGCLRVIDSWRKENFWFSLKMYWIRAIENSPTAEYNLNLIYTH